MREITFKEATELYLRESEDVLSKRTIDEYRHDLHHWNDYLSNKLVSDVNKIDVDKFREYIHSFKQTKNIDGYYYRHLQVLYTFYKFLAAKKIKLGITPSEINLIRKVLRSTKQLQINSKYNGPVVTEEEINKLVQYWESRSEEESALKVRNRLILSLIYDTGIKTGEIVRVLISDYIPGHQTIFIGDRNKKKVRRELELSDRTAKLINSYLSYRRGLSGRGGLYEDNAPELIVSYSSNEHNIMQSHPILSRTIQRFIQQTVDEAGFVRKDITPKSLRATAIINDLLAEDVENKIIYIKYGFKGVTGYQQYLPKAKEMAGITSLYLNLPGLALRYGVPYNYALDVCRKGLIPYIYFRNNYYINPHEINDELLKKFANGRLR